MIQFTWPVVWLQRGLKIVAYNITHSLFEFYVHILYLVLDNVYVAKVSQNRFSFRSLERMEIVLCRENFFLLKQSYRN